MQIGDQVKCIHTATLEGNDCHPPLVENAIYTINQVHQCTAGNCKELHIDVGLVCPWNYVQCYKCRVDLPNTHRGGTYWCNSIRFELVKEAKKEEDGVSIKQEDNK